MINTGIIDTRQPVNLRHPLTRGLVSRWKNVPHFRGGDKVRDLCRHNHANDGTWTNGKKWVGSSRPGGMGAWEFTPADSDHFTVPDHDSFDMTDSQVTVTAWFHSPNTGAYRHILIQPVNATWSSPHLRYGLRIEPANKLLFFAVNSSTYAYGATVHPPNEWVFAAGTYDKQNVRVYLNAEEDDSTAATAAISASTQPLHIGSTNVPGEYFDGYLDDVCLFNRALSAVELRAWMHCTRQRFDPTLNWVTQPTAFASTPVSPYYYQHLLAG